MAALLSIDRGGSLLVGACPAPLFLSLAALLPRLGEASVEARLVLARTLHERLLRTLRELHRGGHGAHGALDAAHVCLTRHGGVSLLLSSLHSAASEPAADLAALGALLMRVTPPEAPAGAAEEYAQMRRAISLLIERPRDALAEPPAGGGNGKGGVIGRGDLSIEEIEAALCSSRGSNRSSPASPPRPPPVSTRRSPERPSPPGRGSLLQQLPPPPSPPQPLLTAAVLAASAAAAEANASAAAARLIAARPPSIGGQRLARSPPQGGDSAGAGAHAVSPFNRAPAAAAVSVATAAAAVAAAFRLEQPLPQSQQPLPSQQLPAPSLRARLKQEAADRAAAEHEAALMVARVAAHAERLALRARSNPFEPSGGSTAAFRQEPQQPPRTLARSPSPPQQQQQLQLQQQVQQRQPGLASPRTLREARLAEQSALEERLLQQARVAAYDERLRLAEKFGRGGR